MYQPGRSLRPAGLGWCQPARCGHECHALPCPHWQGGRPFTPSPPTLPHPRCCVRTPVERGCSRPPQSFRRCYPPLKTARPAPSYTTPPTPPPTVPAPLSLLFLSSQEADGAVVCHTWDSTVNAQFDLKTLPARLRMSLGERGALRPHSSHTSHLALMPLPDPPIHTKGLTTLASSLAPVTWHSLSRASSGKRRLGWRHGDRASAQPPSNPPPSRWAQAVRRRTSACGSRSLRCTSSRRL